MSYAAKSTYEGIDEKQGSRGLDWRRVYIAAISKNGGKLI